MKKVSMLVGAVIVAMLVAVVGVAQANQNAANNEAQCTAVGGTFTSGNPNVCEWTTQDASQPYSETTMEAGNSGKGWEVHGNETTTTNHRTTKGTGPGVYTSTPGTPVRSVDSCTNPGGKEMDLSHKHCQL